MLDVPKQCERNWLSFRDQPLDPATRLSTRRFKVVFSENPQLRGFDRAKCGHGIVAEWRSEDKSLALLAYLGSGVRQNKMRIIAMQVFVPRLFAVLSSDSVETIEAFGEAALEYSFGR